MDDPNSRIDRVTYRGRETVACVIEADNMAARVDGGVLVVELFRYGNTGRCVESYQLRLCPEDRKRLAAIA